MLKAEHTCKLIPAGKRARRAHDLLTESRQESKAGAGEQSDPGSGAEPAVPVFPGSQLEPTCPVAQ